MVALAGGIAVLAALLWAARAFSRASVAGIKALLAWIAALAGLSLACLLLLTGRGGAAVGAAVLFGPLILQWWRRHAKPPPAADTAANAGTRMTRADALAVLGLHDPVTDETVRAAWVRAMRAAHPDHGGSDWLAARVNQARDLLLRER